MNKKELKEKYFDLFKHVSETINEWDPYSLLETGAPSDEFDSEIASIVARIKEIKTENDAILVISEIFKKSFDDEVFSIKHCSLVGIKLYKKLEEFNLIESP